MVSKAVTETEIADVTSEKEAKEASLVLVTEAAKEIAETEEIETAVSEIEENAQKDQNVQLETEKIW